jgi:chromosome segregation ATPase
VQIPYPEQEREQHHIMLQEAYSELQMRKHEIQDVTDRNEDLLRKYGSLRDAFVDLEQKADQLPDLDQVVQDQRLVIHKLTQQLAMFEASFGVEQAELREAAMRINARTTILREQEQASAQMQEELIRVRTELIACQARLAVVVMPSPVPAVVSPVVSPVVDREDVKASGVEEYAELAEQLRGERARCVELTHKLQQIERAFAEAVHALEEHNGALARERDQLATRLECQAQTIHLLTSEQDQHAPSIPPLPRRGGGGVV